MKVGTRGLHEERDTTPKTLARVLFDRIGNVERNRLQTKLLLALSELPIWHDMVFRGAVAIHGVWLHGRSSQDIDFLAPAAIKFQFVQLMAERGMYMERSLEAHMPFLTMHGTIFKDIAVGVDICERMRENMKPVQEIFVGAGGVKIPVNVLPLSGSMAEKLRATSRRSMPSDFFDLWLFSHKFPNVFQELREHLHVGLVEGEEIEYSRSKTWKHFLESERLWYDSLAPYMPRVPDFQMVRNELEEFFEVISK